MDLNYTPEQEAFRTEVRQFLDENLPDDIRERVQKRLRPDKAMTERWQKILFDKGWGASTWPEEFGGTGWDPIQQIIFEEECAIAGAPRQLDFGLRMVAPVIMTFGNDEQKQRFLPGILSGEDWWCQGYSEPGAGSDLASLRTSAKLEGDHYVVNGQKTWTTLGQHADWIFCLVRTSTEGKPQQGISFLLIDMNTPGIEVRPIIMLDGEHEINEVYFDNVKVPAENLVGEENKGWTYAKFLLGHERTGLANVGQWKALMKRLKEVARQEQDGQRPLIENIRFRDRLAQLDMELRALELTVLRVLTDKNGPGALASSLKIRGTEVGQQLFEMLMEAGGQDSIAHIPEALELEYNGPRAGSLDATPSAGDYFNMRKLSIFGGSNEIQRNIIAQLVLGL
ncbi:acyl-CoA dehydrogenase family protein [Marinobacter sp. ATCH36]|uniref:acyl-CoA dehydrogenase family protein n=1 Tax=Marinobacter sp. ATCH36 TaxID=2945106 RepID=UPI00201FEF10|nr:acyl-CoA dehydrogenase family protein [Marinobacter sp. ATCH36]MCL7942812.1 acyl-CoA dehydrogenase family protein [Marinobacter sp. ATCH36]